VSTPGKTRTGRVYLVGAGPGDPGLITLRGAQCLARADLVLYDYLVNPAVLRHAPASAELVCLGRHGHGRILSRAEINQRMVAAAMTGLTVVRLKGGDPMIFARAADELEALNSAGIDFEIVPGVTAAVAVAAYAGVPLTQRDHASAVALVTGREDAAKGADLDFDALARFPGTLVFYMGVTTADSWTERLIASGKPADTPAAIVRRCSWPDQTTVFCRLEEVAGRIAAGHIRPPALVAVGEVCAAAGTLDWFTSRPLFGQRVLVTRPEQLADELARGLSELGADVLLQPAIAIGEPPDWQCVDDAIGRLAAFDWLVFSSANGVTFFLDRVCKLGHDMRWLGGVRLAAIGTATAARLAEYHLNADLVPDEFRAESLAAGLSVEARGRRFLLVRASRGREVLAAELAAAGAAVEQVVAYSSVDVPSPAPEIAAAMSAGRIDCVTVTSSAIARSLAAMFGSSLARTKLASISPVTSQTLRELGYEPAVEANPFTTEALIEAILSTAKNK
jgi:uroporphyrinogen III methyltransferase/synthase